MEGRGHATFCHEREAPDPLVFPERRRHPKRVVLREAIHRPLEREEQ
jgi:hypothetical protein